MSPKLTWLFLISKRLFPSKYRITNEKISAKICKFWIDQWRPWSQYPWAVLMSWQVGTAPVYINNMHSSSSITTFDVTFQTLSHGFWTWPCCWLHTWCLVWSTLTGKGNCSLIFHLVKCLLVLTSFHQLSTTINRCRHWLGLIHTELGKHSLSVTRLTYQG